MAPGQFKLENMEAKESVPRLKGQILSEKINVAVEPELKAELQNLKSVHKVDVPKWIRWLIKSNIADLKRNVSGA